MNTEIKNNQLIYLWLSAVSVLTLVLYYQGVNGPFLYDDQGNLLSLGKNGGIKSFQDAIGVVLGNNSGPLGRPVAMASFILNAQNWPTDPFYFKATNIVLHIICGWLIFVLSSKLLVQISSLHFKSKIPYIALCASSLWLLHPLNVSTTLYVVQRMTQLSTIFSILSIILFLQYRPRLINSIKIQDFFWPTTLITFFVSLAVLSKENSLLVFPAMFMINYFCNSYRTSKLFKLWVFGLFILPFIICVAYIYTISSSIALSYTYKDFTLAQRLITELYVVGDYISQIYLPNYTRMSLFHDDILVSNTLFNATSASYLLLLVGLLSLLLTKIEKIYKFAISWFFIWHLMESTALPLDLYFEHRNYIPSIGALLGLSFGIFHLCEKLFPNNNKAPIVISTIYGFILALQLSILTSIWSSEESLYMNWLTYHEKSKATLLSLVSIYGERGHIELAYTITNKALSFEHAKNDIAVNLKLYTLQCTLKKSTSATEQNILKNISKKEYFSPHISPVYINMVQRILKNHCTPTDYEKLNNIITEIINNSPQNNNNIWLSSMFGWQASLYLHQDLLDEALKSYIKSFNNRKSTNTLIAIVDLNIYLKKFPEAQLWIEKAESYNLKSIIGNKDISEDIIFLQNKLNEELINIKAI